MKNRKWLVLTTNIICGMLMLAVLICQFVPFWVMEGETSDSGSLFGVTGRQYKHEELISFLDVKTDGFSYEDISVPVLITIAMSALGVYLCIRNSRGWLRIVAAVGAAAAGVFLWLTVPAYTLGVFGTVLFVLDIILLLMAIFMIVLYIQEKSEERKLDKEKKIKMMGNA